MDKGILTISRERFLTDIKKYMRMVSEKLSIKVMGEKGPAYYFFVVDELYSWQNENEPALWKQN